MTPRPVRFVTLALPPRFAVFDVETGLYLCGFLSPENRAEHCARCGYRIVERE